MRGDQEVVDALWRLFEARGDNTIQAVEKRLGLYQNRLHKAKSRRSGLYVSEVLMILEGLGVSPSGFFSSVFGRPEATQQFIREGAKLSRKHLISFPEFPRDDDSFKADPSVIEGRVKQIKSLIPLDCRAAEREAEKAFRSAVEAGCREIALKAAALRSRALLNEDKLERAHVVIAWALEASRGTNLFPEMIRRSARIKLEQGRFLDAVSLANEAIVAASEIGDADGVAAGLLVRASGLRRLGGLEEARKGLNAALDWCSGAVPRIQFAIIHELGLFYEQIGQLAKAEEFANRSLEFGLPPGPDGGRVFWLLARIACDREDYVAADDYYRQALDRVATSPSTATQVACELARMYLLQERRDRATGLACGLLRLIRHGGNRLVRDILNDLSLSALRGSLDLPKIEAALEKLSATLTVAETCS